jgi:hypothetical protein
MASVIVKNPAVLSGEPVFRGTRVPFKALTDYLEGGESLGEFLEHGAVSERDARGSDCGAGRGAGQPDGASGMKVLIDECAPKAMKVVLAASGFDCTTGQEAGWSGKDNDELLAPGGCKFRCDGDD